MEGAGGRREGIDRLKSTWASREGCGGRGEGEGEDIQIDLNEFSNREFLIEVENIENMGSEIYAYFKLGDFNLKLKSQNLNIKKNSKLNILFNLENISIFDIDSEENILYTY